MADVVWVAGALADAAARGEPVVLATVVRTEGSTYRRTGARMILQRDGTAVGAVSGGCLETDLAARVDGVFASNRPALITYDTRADEDLVWGLGLGCNGRVDVLLEPLAGDRLTHAATLYAACRDLDRPATLATVIAVVHEGDGWCAGPAAAKPRIGNRLLVTDDSAWPAGLSPSAARAALVDDARAALRVGRSTVRSYRWNSVTRGRADGGGTGSVLPPTVDVLHEVLAPPISLLVCGAGPDAVPVARLAASLGWRVTVVDDRPGHARADRFPDAHVRLLAPGEPATAAWPNGRLPHRAAAVVMGHHYERDRTHLAALLATSVGYLGVLGPRRRTARLLADLGAEAAVARLHAPVGLDLGAETPEEIALAIVAEVQGVLNARAAVPLRERRGGIHDPEPAAERPEVRLSAPAREMCALTSR